MGGDERVIPGLEVDGSRVFIVDRCLPLQEGDPFILLLVVPNPIGGGLTARNDPFDLKPPPVGYQGLEQLPGRKGGRERDVPFWHILKSEATSSHRLRRGSTLALRGRGIKPRP